MNQQKEKAFATVTFAMYDEAPIACQGDDDQNKIQVFTDNLVVGDDIHGAALRRSITLGALHGSYVQVWEVQIHPAPKNDIK